MLYRSKELKGRKVAGVDEEVGKVTDIYFDDERWAVRYFVVETGSWLNSRPVLVSPASLVAEQPDSSILKTSLTREQITNSPPVDTHRPVSRQYEIDYAAYYGYPDYWMGGGLWGAHGLPLGPHGVMPPRESERSSREKAARQQSNQDSHLRSCREVIGYDIHARDGDIGHLDEYLIDPDSWQIKRLIIDTRNWLPGKEVLLEPSMIQRVDWPDKKVDVQLTRDEVKALPQGLG